MKIEAHRAFIQLKREISMLRRIDTTKDLRQLLDIAARSPRRVLRTAIEARVFDSQAVLPDG